MDIDKPLDDIIKQRRSARGPARGRGRGGVRGGAAGRGAARGGAAASSTGPVRNRHTGAAAASGAAGPAASAPGKPVLPLMADGSKIIVSNLPTDVTENQIRDLFATTVGPVTRVSLSYDKNGRSTGSAAIDFKKPTDAQKAFQNYNTRLVDGNKPMKVEIIFDPSRLPPPPLNSRIAPAPKSTPIAVSPVDAAPRGRGGKAVGRGRGRGRGGRRGEDRPKPTEADLDAEMEDYQKNLAT